MPESECGEDQAERGRVDADDPGADAADYPVEVLRGTDMGGSGCEDGEEGDGG